MPFVYAQEILQTRSIHSQSKILVLLLTSGILQIVALAQRQSMFTMGRLKNLSSSYL